MSQYVKIQCLMRVQRHEKIKLCLGVLEKGFCNGTALTELSLEEGATLIHMCI